MKIKTTVEVEVSRSRIADLLCCGMEGGVGYWARVIGNVEPPKGSSLEIGGGSWDDGNIYKHIHYPMCEAGGGVMIEDADGEDSFKPTLLDWAALQKGLQIMANDYPRHFGNFINEEDDAETGDVFVQCALLGEIVFG